jgi:glyoxylase-like metal-dependent hydrolase (beta-lactamase superfamily II)
MSVKLVVAGLWQLKISYVNAFLLETEDGLVLIDTGTPDSGRVIQDALSSIGKKLTDIRHILVTHCHADHSGSLAEMKSLTSAPATMHPVDAEMVEAGKAKRPLTPAPGLFNTILCKLILHGAPSEITAAKIDYKVQDGETLPCGLKAIHLPGHCAGQVAFLLPKHGGVLFAADTAAHVFGLGLSPMYEDLAEGRRSLAKLGELEFEVACFGHGRPILKAASKQFGQKWPVMR